MCRERNNSFIFCVLILVVLGASSIFLTSGFAQPARTSLRAQPNAPDLRFKHLTIDDGLSQGMVNAICQDRQGFMWFGTRDGLNRYDGYQFTVFRNNPFDSTSLSHNHITEIFEDRRGRLWIGTVDGLNCFDPETEKFRRFLHSPDDPTGLSDNSITAICEAPARTDSERNSTMLWIGTRSGGLNKLVLQEGDHDFVRYEHRPDDANSLSSNHIFDLLMDRSGVLWIGTDLDLCRLDPPHSLSRAANGSGIFARYDFEWTWRYGIYARQCFSLFEARDGSIWAGLTGNLVRVASDNDPSRSLKHYEFATMSDWKNAVRGICEDPQGVLWLPTSQGLRIFDPKKEKFRWIRHDPENPTSLSYDHLSSIFRDRTNAIWIGTAGFGINRGDSHSRPFHTYNPERLALKSGTELSIFGLLEDRRGLLWIFANPDWYQLDRKIGTLVRPQLNNALGEVNSFHEDRDGFLWITRIGGVFRYDGQSAGIERIFPPPDESPFCIYAIHEDHNGDMWFGTASFLSEGVVTSPKRDALYRWDRETGVMEEYPIAVPRNFAEGGLDIRRLVQDRSRAFWMATNRGLIRFDPQNILGQRGALKIFQNEPENPASLNYNDLKTLLLDPLRPDRFLWLGTNGGGLSRFDFAAEVFSHYTEEQGLPNNVVYGILADDAGNLWMSTNKGLSKAITEPKTRDILRFRNYDVGDGLQSNEFNTNAYFKNAGGEMFFGGIKGLTVFHPDSIKDNPYVPPVVFTALDIRYRNVKPGQPGSPLQKSINTTETITLAPEDNVMTFEFAALDYSAPEKNLYSYKLEGFEENWSPPSRNRRATYTDLDPGEYVFCVRGSNSDGVWNEAGATTKLIVTPPWWKTWWAYMLYFFLGAGSLYSLWRYELSRMRLKDQVKLEQLEAQKLQELDQMKSRFFANISHEFRTPLTLILGPIENLLRRLDDKQSTQDLSLMRKHAGNLLRLVNQLLDLAKLEAGKMKLQASPGDLVKCLKSVIAFFESLAKSRNIALHFHSELDQLEAWFDRDHLEKVFYNLLSNAMKFTPEGGEISVQLSVASNQLSVASDQLSVNQLITDHRLLITDHWILITVKDTGIGIPAEELPFVFDRFYQAGIADRQKGAVREFEGTGIGLALVKELVELHHGVVRIHSEAGASTEVVVCLPLGKAHLKPEEVVQGANTVAVAGAVAVAPEKNIPTIHQSTDPEIKQPTDPEIQQSTDPTIQPSGDETIILVVEDNADMRGYIRRHLESSYQVLEAADGKEGFDQAIAAIPDLVISDVMMPKLDGYQLCEKLKTDERTSHIPVILLTAKADREGKLEGLETGADDYLTKPFDAQELHARVKNLIALRRQLQEKFKRQLILQPGEVQVDSMDEAFLKKAVAIVEENLETESFSVEDLARQTALSRVQLHRKLRALTNQPASHFIRAIRLQRAAELIKKDAATITEIAYLVGFSSHPYFTKCFQEYFGLTPTEYKKQNG